MRSKKILQYVVAVVIGIVLFFYCAISRDLFEQSDRTVIMGILSDAFVVPGVFLAGCGGLSAVAYQGTFLFFRYAGNVLLSQIRHPKEPAPSYYDYKVEREAHRKPWLRGWLFTGLIFLALGILCLIVYLV